MTSSAEGASGSGDWVSSLRLDGKVALVTGAGGGIGSAVVDLLSAMGAKVVATDASERGLAGLPQDGAGGPPILADLAGKGACDALVAETVARHGAVDILVNNAALLIRKEVDEYDDTDWDLTFDVNLRSQFLLCRAAARSMKERGWGRIVNFAASNVYNGGLYQSSLYAIAKGGTLTLTRSFASRLAPFGICVNTIAPGPVNTPMFSYRLTEANIAEFKGKMPMGRIGEPIEIARCVAFLSSPWASYLTGQVMDANGGQLFR
ncbi:MAG: SDR family oxidoreductase [Rhizobiales bacterium]|nr:SDR family oxidoreductase [Hyphomicrobiales bacterium]